MMTAIDDVRVAIRDPNAGNNSFSILGKLAKLLGEYGTAPPELLECVAWAKEREDILVGESSARQEMMDDICRCAGLYHYIKAPEQSFVTGLVREVFRSPSLNKVVLHRAQAEVFWDLIQGKNLLLSAPTSFGKSALVDSLLASGQYKRVAIVVPTIALLDETRRRLSRLFQDTFDIVWHRRQAATREQVIFVQTQERLLERSDVEHLDLLIIDEFYKVDPKRGDTRARSLNRAIYRYAPLARQVYALGPNIDQIAFQSIGNKSFALRSTKFRTVATDVIDRTGIAEAERLGALRSLLGDLSDEPTVVFTRSPARAVQIARALVETGFVNESSWGAAAGELLADQVHPEWATAKALRRGIALHHGRVLRSIAQLQVAAFNEREVNTIICTSTLIEGVNTAAKNVVIFDNRVDTKKMDFFTFSNIAGRAGRMMQHYVGRVFLFDEPPVSREISLELPIFSEEGIQEHGFEFDVRDEELAQSGRDKVLSTLGVTELERNTIARLMDFLVTSVEDFARELRAIADSRPDQLQWVGQPDFEQLSTFCEIAFRHFGRKKFAAKSPRQAAFFLSRLAAAHGNLRPFLDLFRDWDSGKPVEENLEMGFKFLRDCEFNFPQAFLLVQQALNEMMFEGFCDYSAYAVRIESWFLDEGVRTFEDLGVPFFLARDLLPLTSSDDIESLSALASPRAIRSAAPQLLSGRMGNLMSVLDPG